MALSALLTLANLLLSLAVGVRLLRLGRGPGRVEIWLGLYFAAAAFLGTLVNVLAYADFAGALALPAPLASARLSFVAILANSVGALGLYGFTWLTFRPRSGAARAFALAGAAGMLAGLLAQAGTEGFAPRVLPGASYWIGWSARLAPCVWIALESLHYHRQLRRRLALGLADPVLCNRFLLWGVWASATAAQNLSDLLMRLFYVAATGETQQLLVEPAQVIMVSFLAASSILGVVSAATLLLTFFPTRTYLVWIAQRAARQQV